MKQFCSLYHRFKVTQFKNGCVYKTKKIGQAWFLWGKGPKIHIHDEKNEFWVATLTNEMRDTWETVK